VEVPTIETCLPAGHGVYGVHADWLGTVAKEPAVQSAHSWSVEVVPGVDTWRPAMHCVYSPHDAASAVVLNVPVTQAAHARSLLAVGMPLTD
jgi:hypothetical protein